MLLVGPESPSRKPGQLEGRTICLEPNRGALTLLARYAYEQHITSRTLTPEEL